MKRIIALVTLLVLTLVLITGCSGVSKDSYDAAVKEFSDLKAQLSSVQADLTKSKTDLTTAQADLSKSKADLATAQQNLNTVVDDRDSIIKQLDKVKADLTTAQASLSKSNADLATAQQSFSTLNTSVKTYQPYVEASTLWFDMWANHASWSQANWDAWNVKFTSAISNTQDSAMQTLLNTMRTTTGSEHENAEMALTNLLIQRLTEKLPETQ
jgi:chromosome segregation ATPase